MEKGAYRTLMVLKGTSGDSLGVLWSWGEKNQINLYVQRQNTVTLVFGATQWDGVAERFWVHVTQLMEQWAGGLT